MTPAYRIANPSITEQFLRRNPGLKADLLDALTDICTNPIGPPPDKKHLKGSLNCRWRKRFARTFRVIYSFDPGTLLVRILTIGPRSNVYS